MAILRIYSILIVLIILYTSLKTGKRDIDIVASGIIFIPILVYLVLGGV